MIHFIKSENIVFSGSYCTEFGTIKMQQVAIILSFL